MSARERLIAELVRREMAFLYPLVLRDVRVIAARDAESGRWQVQLLLGEATQPPLDEAAVRYLHDTAHRIAEREDRRLR